MLQRNLIGGPGAFYRSLRGGLLWQQGFLALVLGLVFGDGGSKLGDLAFGLRDTFPRCVDPCPGRLDLLLELRPRVVSFHFGLRLGHLFGQKRLGAGEQVLVALGSATPLANGPRSVEIHGRIADEHKAHHNRW